MGLTESDHIRCHMLNTGVSNSKSYTSRVIGICGLKIVSRGYLMGILVISD